ncbi:MAG: ABC transporter ATP-binding protein [Planctomycetota bacterium]
MDEEALRASDLTKIYTDFWGRPRVLALDSLDLTVHRGEVFGLLGPNGSGKTTTAKLFLGLLWPTRGSASLLGRPPADVEVKHRIGYLPEESYFYRFLTGRETIEFYARFFGMGRARRRARAGELLEMVGISAAADRRLSEYSKGMLRRIGLAQALVNDPELVVLDEPTSGLDPVGTRQVKDLVLDLRSRGRTVVLNSHLLADMEDICDRVAILHRGNLRSIGPLSELLERGEVDEIQFKGLEPARVEEIAGEIRTRGGEVVASRHPRRTLEEYFLDAIGEKGAAGPPPPPPAEDSAL